MYSSSSQPRAITPVSPASSTASVRQKSNIPNLRLDGGTSTARSNAQKVLSRAGVAERLKVLSSTAAMDDSNPAAVKDKTKIISELLEISRFLQIEANHSAVVVDQLNEAMSKMTSENKALTEKVAKLQDALRHHEMKAENIDITADRLNEQLRSIEADIKRYDTTGIHVSLSKPKQIVAETTEGRVALMQELLSKRVEDLVVVLKKRIARFEETSSLSSVVADHGDLPSLLSENAKLKAENELLRLREMRFSPSSLLRRRKLMECEPGFLRLLIIALQNELAAARKVIDKYGFERNPTLGLLVRSPVPHEDPRSLKDIEEVFEEKDWDTLMAQFTPTGKQEYGTEREGDDLSLLRERNALLEMTVGNLSSLLNESERVRSHFEEIVREREDILKGIVGSMGHGAKDRRIAELQVKNEALVKSENELLSLLAKKDNTLLFQEERMQESVRERQMLQEENSSLSLSLLSHVSKTKEATLSLLNTKKQLKALHMVSLTMCQSLMERYGVPIRSRQAVVAYMFSDVFETYARCVAAAVRLQSAFRGAIARRRQGVARTNIRYLQLAFHGREALDQRERERERERDSEEEEEDEEEYAAPMCLSLKGLPQEDGSLLNSNRLYLFTYYRSHTPRHLGVTGPSIYISGNPTDTPRPLSLSLSPPSSEERERDEESGEQSLSHSLSLSPSSPEQREFLLRLIKRDKERRERERGGGKEREREKGDLLDYGCLFAADPRAVGEDGKPLGLTSALDRVWRALEDAQGLAPVPETSPVVVKAKPFMPAYSALSAIVSTVETDFERIMRPNVLLAIARKEISDFLIPQVNDELRNMRNTMKETVAAVRRSHESVLLKEHISRSTQCKIPLASSSVQTESAQPDDLKSARSVKGPIAKPQIAKK